MTLADTILALNPIAYWKLDETSGTVATNYGSLGAAANGTYSGVTLASVAAPGGGSAPYFDGANDQVNIYSTALNGGFSGAECTIVAFAKVYNSSVWTDGIVRHIIDIRTADGDYIVLRKSNATNRSDYLRRAGANVNSNLINVANTSTDWRMYSITVSQSGGAVKYYLDASSAGADNTTLGAWSGAITSTLCHIGSYLSTPSLVWNGYISHAAIFTSVLTAEQIAAIYAASQNQAYSLTADAGGIAVSGQTASFKRGYTLSAYRGLYTLTGQNAILKYPYSGEIGCVTTADTTLYTVTASDTCLYTVTASDMRCT